MTHRVGSMQLIHALISGAMEFNKKYNRTQYLSILKVQFKTKGFEMCSHIHSIIYYFKLR